jgi:hypothetical protein
MKVIEIRKYNRDFERLFEAIYEWWHSVIGEDEFVSITIRRVDKRYYYLIVRKIKHIQDEPIVDAIKFMYLY